jgi:hypothetical protein
MSLKASQAELAGLTLRDTTGSSSYRELPEPLTAVTMLSDYASNASTSLTSCLSYPENDDR